MNSIISFYEGKTADHLGRHINYIWGQDDNYLEKSHDYIQYLFPNKESSAINPHAPLLTDEIIEEFKSRSDLKTSVKRSLDVMVKFYQMDDTYPWWCTKNNHNYLRCTRILHTLKAFDMQEELDEFYNSLMVIYENNKEVIKRTTFGFWQDAYLGEQEYLIRVAVKATVVVERGVNVRAYSLEEAKRLAIEEVEENVNIVADRNYEMTKNFQEITDIVAEEDE